MKTKLTGPFFNIPVIKALNDTDRLRLMRVLSSIVFQENLTSYVNVNSYLGLMCAIGQRPDNKLYQIVCESCEEDPDYTDDEEPLYLTKSRVGNRFMQILHAIKTLEPGSEQWNEEFEEDTDLQKCFSSPEDINLIKQIIR